MTILENKAPVASGVASESRHALAELQSRLYALHGSESMFCRNRIIARTAPRVTTRYAPNTQPKTMEKSVFFYCLGGIDRTAGLKATSGQEKMG